MGRERLRGGFAPEAVTRLGFGLLVCVGEFPGRDMDREPGSGQSSPGSVPALETRGVLPRVFILLLGLLVECGSLHSGMAHVFKAFSKKKKKKNNYKEKKKTREHHGGRST